MLVRDDEDRAATGSQISDALTRHLPSTFRGYSTNFAKADENGVRWMVPGEAGRIDHHVYIHTVSGFVRLMLNIEPGQTLDSVDWLLMSQQKLLEITSGEVFHDGLDARFRSAKDLHGIRPTSGSSLSRRAHPQTLRTHSHPS